MWHVASPSEYLAITGGSTDDIKLMKKALTWRTQKCHKFDISPVSYTFKVQLMSAENLPFQFHAVYTIGPRVTDDESLLLYAKFIIPLQDNRSSHIKELVQGLVESESHVIAASMTRKQIFKGTGEFKRDLLEKLQVELNKFGLVIYTKANVKQLVKAAGHERFSDLGLKTHIEATNQVKESKLAEANAELVTKNATCSQLADLAKVEAAKQVALREAELQVQIEINKTSSQTEKLRAQLLSKAIVEYEIKVQEANWELHKKQTAADAVLYENLRKADAEKATADATSYARQQAEEAKLLANINKAKGIQALAQAEGEYLAMLTEQFQGDHGAMKDYLMLRPGGFQELPMFSLGADKVVLVSKSESGPAGKGLRKGGVGGEKKDVAGVNAMLPPMFRFKALHELVGQLSLALLRAGYTLKIGGQDLTHFLFFFLLFCWGNLGHWFSLGWQGIRSRFAWHLV